MSERELVVLDSSAGVKWFKPESGREQARELLERHREGACRIVVSSLFNYELVGVAARHGGVGLAGRVWSALRGADLTVVGMDDTVARAAFEQCGSLGCTFYDALAPALAALLGATLYSADARAHGGFEGVRLLGEVAG